MYMLSQACCCDCEGDTYCTRPTCTAVLPALLCSRRPWCHCCNIKAYYYLAGELLNDCCWPSPPGPVGEGERSANPKRVCAAGDRPPKSTRTPAADPRVDDDIKSPNCAESWTVVGCTGVQEGRLVVASSRLVLRMDVKRGQSCCTTSFSTRRTATTTQQSEFTVVAGTNGRLACWRTICSTY